MRVPPPIAAREYVFNTLVGRHLAWLASPAGCQGAAVHVLNLRDVAGLTEARDLA